MAGLSRRNYLVMTRSLGGFEVLAHHIEAMFRGLAFRVPLSDGKGGFRQHIVAFVPYDELVFVRQEHEA